MFAPWGKSVKEGWATKEGPLGGLCPATNDRLTGEKPLPRSPKATLASKAMIGYFAG